MSTTKTMTVTLEDNKFKVVKFEERKTQSYVHYRNVTEDMNKKMNINDVLAMATVFFSETETE